MHWVESGKNAILDFDREDLALLLNHLPTEIPLPASEEDEAEPPPTFAGPLLFLRPNTWPLECHRRALATLENQPSPRIEPLIRLVTAHGTWSEVGRQNLAEDAWVFLRGEADASLRDGTIEQRDFVCRALGTPDFALLEGPPGSGKTTAICELIVQLARARKRVLLVASTHVAVDNVLERIIEWQDESIDKPVLPIRIGHEGSITSAKLEPWTLGHLKRTWHGEILDFLDNPRGSATAGASARLMLKDALANQKDGSALVDLLLESSNLICGTTIGILQHPKLKRRKREDEDLEPFDFMILDEASKTTFTEFLVPAAYAKRWVVVGDKRQLSPYVEEQDLEENLRSLLPPEVSRATAHAFLASSAVPRGQQVSALIAVTSVEEANCLAEEARARDVVAIDLDRVAPVTLHGVEGACSELLYADLVFGRPETIAAWEHRLPGELRAVAGNVPELLDWQAHRRALKIQSKDEPVAWETEVAWRQVRAHELRSAPPEQQHFLDQLSALRPTNLGPSFLQRHRPRKVGAPSRLQTPNEVFDENLENMRRVAMPSILEIFQDGAGSRGSNQSTPLTDGLPKDARDQRMVSLSFQHRMHPDISAFPRSEFYAAVGLLRDASGVQEARQWDYPRYKRRGCWIGISPSRQNRGRAVTANNNPEEAGILIRELQEFAKWAASAPRSSSNPYAPWEVAVLTFYRDQEKLLRSRLQSISGQHGSNRNFQLPRGEGRVHVTLCTVDRFQGHEADLVFISFVKSRSVGFLNSPNRINVALTRARYQLVLIGDRSWMASKSCKSPLLQRLSSSSLYEHHLGWE